MYFLCVVISQILYMQASAAAQGPKQKETTAKKPAPAPKAAKPKPDAKEAEQPAKKPRKAATAQDGDKVKRAKNAFMFFSAEKRAAVKGKLMACFTFSMHMHAVF